MSDFISTSKYIKHKIEGGDYNKYKNVLDLDGDGVISSLEIDQVESFVLQNTLETIKPDLTNFRLDTGLYLTEQQNNDRAKFTQLLNKYLKEQKEEDKDLTIHRRHKIPKYENGQPTDSGSLSSDLKQRRYLEDSELNIES